MSEAINLLEKKLQEVRNQIQGLQSKFDAADEALAYDQAIYETLTMREINLNLAINTLKK